jgi:ATP synthase protein I
MLANYAPIVRRSALTSGAVAAVLLAVGTAVAGVKGLLAALIAAAVVAAFFGIDLVAVGRAARISPAFMMAAAMFTYTVKILVLVVLVARFQHTTVFDTWLAGFAVFVLVLAYTGAHVFWSLRTKMPFVDVDRTDRG